MLVLILDQCIQYINSNQLENLIKQYVNGHHSFLHTWLYYFGFFDKETNCYLYFEIYKVKLNNSEFIDLF